MAKRNLLNPDDFKMDPIPVFEPVEETPVTPAKPEKAVKPTETGKKAMPIYLSLEQHAYLSYIARKRKLPMNSVIKELIDADIQNNPDVFERAKEFI